MCCACGEAECENLRIRALCETCGVPVSFMSGTPCGGCGEAFCNDHFLGPHKKESESCAKERKDYLGS